MILQIHIDKLNLSSEMLQEVLALQNLSETEFYARLSKIFRDAGQYRQFHRKRHRKAKERAIRWGAEYHAILKKYLAAGLRSKTAKTAAKREFIATHPRPKNADDLMKCDEYPGHSRPSLRHYQKTYLDSLLTPTPTA